MIHNNFNIISILYIVSINNIIFFNLYMNYNFIHTHVLYSIQKDREREISGRIFQEIIRSNMHNFLLTIIIAYF